MTRDEDQRDENLSPTEAFKEGLGLIRTGLSGVVGGLRREFKQGRLTENLREAGRELEKAVRAAVDGVAQELPPNFIKGQTAGQRVEREAAKASTDEPEAAEPKDAPPDEDVPAEDAPAGGRDEP